MKRAVTAAQVAELEVLRAQGGGLLRLPAIVAFARDPGTACHPWFEWDAVRGHEKYLLLQARQLVQAVITVDPGQLGITTPMRAYVSILSDRHPAGGYRAITTVLDDTALRAALLDTALMELRMMQRKYALVRTLVLALQGVIEGVEGGAHAS